MSEDDNAMPILFYDGRCSLCAREMKLLEPRLTGKIVLKNLHDANFEAFKGVGKISMMKQLHLWDGQQFITGFDASLYYWQLAGFHRTTRLLRLPPLYVISRLGYRLWAHWREKSGKCSLE
ncbi:thiol-disulfide oxidoreductase DCC family protein [Alkalimonas amylolytica]|uniref:thiol-disulfide oxidoreductase DCC family protein n=1 Tax=Alkalimonas amylolytica TaxID=152573 RepID=UPI001114ACD1|nr:DUF393 domain-containing protein [Alkalimonas amylolytica]